MKERQIEILKILIENELTPISELMAQFKKSERSLRYDIEQIREELENFKIILKNKPVYGYYIDQSQIQECQRLIKTNLLVEKYFENQDLENKLFIRLFSVQESITLDNLAIQLSTSKSTLNKLITSFNEKNTNIQMKANSKGIFLAGEEYEIRNFAINIYPELEKYIEIPIQILNRIVDALKKVNERFDVWPTVRVYRDLSTYCKVTYLRQKSIQVNEAYNTNEDIYSNYLLENLKFKLNKNEIHMLDRRLQLNAVIIPEGNVIENEIEVKIQELIENILKISANYNIWLSQRELTDDLKRHLGQLAQCMMHGVSLPENPLLSNIKNSYPDYYKIAVEATKNWELIQSEKLSPSEISYIAIYIYQHSLKTRENKIRTLILCASGKGISKLIGTKVVNRFAEIEVVAVENVFKGKKEYNADLIISTVPISNPKIPTIVVSPILDDIDLIKIQNFVGNKENFLDIQVQHESKEHLIDQSNALAAIIIKLTETYSSLPDKYGINAEIINAVILHLTLSIPRMFQDVNTIEEENARKNLDKYQRRYSDLNDKLTDLFINIENVIGKEIPFTEKLPFYIYAIRRVD